MSLLEAATLLAKQELSPDQYHQEHGKCPDGWHWKDKKCVQEGKPGKHLPYERVEHKAPTTTTHKIKHALRHVWHAVVGPFQEAWKLATKKEARAAFKKKMGKAIRKETEETKHMVGTIRRVLRGEKISKEDRDKAIHQFVDLAKTVAVGAMVGHVFAGGLAKALATLASPADEMVGIAIDRPLRKITKKLFGKAHGILPSAFYEDDEVTSAYKDGDEYKILEKMIDDLMDELTKEGVDEDDVARALKKSGFDQKHIKDFFKAIKGKKAEGALLEAVGLLSGYRDIPKDWVAPEDRPQPLKIGDSVRVKAGTPKNRILPRLLPGITPQEFDPNGTYTVIKILPARTFFRHDLSVVISRTQYGPRWVVQLERVERV